MCDLWWNWVLLNQEDIWGRTSLGAGISSEYMVLWIWEVAVWILVFQSSYSLYMRHLFLDLVVWRNRNSYAFLELCIDSCVVYQSKIAPETDFLFYSPEYPLMLSSLCRVALDATCTLQCSHIFGPLACIIQDNLLHCISRETLVCNCKFNAV
jgi:hypothetical protein